MYFLIKIDRTDGETYYNRNLYDTIDDFISDYEIEDDEWESKYKQVWAGGILVGYKAYLYDGEWEVFLINIGAKPNEF